MPKPAERAVVFAAKRIRTMNPASPAAEALVMRDGRIVFVGTRAAAIAAAGDGAAIEDFPNGVIVPGLVDAHAHLMSLGKSLAIVGLDASKSEAEAAALAKSAPKSAFQGQWLLGRGWDQNDWKDTAFPTKASLDAAVGAVPVFFTRIDGHAAWVSSEALRRAGITSATKDPAGGRIERDATGEPTGVLIDNAMELVGEKINPPSPTEQQHRLKIAIELCAKLGLTQVHDAGMDLATFHLLQQWDMVGALPIRLYVMADGQGAEAETWLDSGVFSGRHLEARAVKLLADGALGSRGAALAAPYADDATNSGLLLLSEETLRSKAKAFAARGFQVAVHAIGDRANTLVIDALAALPHDGRHRLEHAQVLSADDVGRLAPNGLIASFQPTHATSDMPWAEKRLGASRAKFAYAWRSVLETGAHVAFGSDFPVEHPNPLWGLYAARTRQDHQGAPAGGWHPEQRVTGLEALAGFTTGAAYAAFAETHRGQITEGFDADFVVLPVDPVSDEPAGLLDAKVLVTVVDGVDVYRAPSP